MWKQLGIESARRCFGASLLIVLVRYRILLPSVQTKIHGTNTRTRTICSVIIEAKNKLARSDALIINKYLCICMVIIDLSWHSNTEEVQVGISVSACIPVGTDTKENVPKRHDGTRNLPVSTLSPRLLILIAKTKLVQVQQVRPLSQFVPLA